MSRAVARIEPGAAAVVSASQGREVAWFALRTQPKHELVAAAHLARMGEIDVFNPRIRYARATQHGPVWVTESLFPNYVFARFNWKTCLNRVHFAPGVNGIVHFGSEWPTIPDEVIEQLRTIIGSEGIQDTERPVAPGDSVRIAGGAFHGLEAVVTQVLPGQQRVAVLLDFLGRQTPVQIPATSITRRVPGR